VTGARVDRALVLAAGRGTRLHPLTAVRAKAAVPVAGEPLVRRLLVWLARQGVRDVVVNLHHLPHTITAVVGDGGELGVRVRYSVEPRLLGTAGGVRHALALLDSRRFFVVNADTISTVALDALAEHHARTGARVTLALTRNPDPSRYSGVVVRDGWVVRFTPAGAGPGSGAGSGSYLFVGLQVVDADVFETLVDGTPADSVADVYQALLGAGPATIAAFVADAEFHDIGTPAHYLDTSLAIARRSGLAPHPLVGDIPPGERCRVAPTARLTRTVLWDDVTIEDGVVLTECIVADGVRVPAGARWTRRILVPARAVSPGPEDEPAGDLLVAPLR
jgi:NDP-sugar pyrophosphorylase family protein